MQKETSGMKSLNLHFKIEIVASAYDKLAQRSSCYFKSEKWLVTYLIIELGINAFVRRIWSYGSEFAHLTERDINHWERKHTMYSANLFQYYWIPYKSYIWDAFRDLMLFVQFKKREKHPWRNVNLSKVAS